MDSIHPPPPPAIITVSGGGGGAKKDSSTQKIRLMISYGGHILPRAHDKTLFYGGGDTRIISVTRTTALSLSSLLTHLSKSLFNGSPHNPFILKYQLPHHDLDSLILISSDEDLHNMIEEYDRVSTTGRIRFFLFKNIENDVAGKGGGVMNDDWFADTLKVAGSGTGSGSGEDVVSPESIVLESSSSFGSTKSSDSPANNNNNKGSDDLKIILPSVDSLGSDTSIPSPSYSQQAMVYQDASGFADARPLSVNVVEIESSVTDHSPRSDILTPVEVSGYMISKPPMNPPQHQTPPPPQYIQHSGPTSHSNYVTNYYPSSIPVAYPPMYQTYVRPPQQHIQYQINKPYPVLMTHVGQTHNIYDASSMHNMTTPPIVSTSQPQVLTNPVVVSPMGYEGYNPTAPLPERGTKAYGPTPVAAQPKPVTLSPVLNPPTQPISAAVLENNSYVSEYDELMRAQIYKTQPSGPT